MYEERKEKFSFKSFFLTLLLVLLFIFLMLWLFPTRNYVDEKLQSTYDLERLSVLYDEIFANNVGRMKDAAIGYFTNERMPQKVGESKKLTLQEMYDLHLVLKMKDKDGKACDVKKSYVEMTKYDEEYRLKVNLSCGEYEDYIIVYLGCYDYCSGGLCEKRYPAETLPEEKPEPTPDPEPTPQPEPTPIVKSYLYEYLLKTDDKTICPDWSNWQKQSVKEENLTHVETKVETEIVGYKTVEMQTGTKVITKITQVPEEYISSYTTQLVEVGSKEIKVGTTTKTITKEVVIGTIEVNTGEVGTGTLVPDDTETIKYKELSPDKPESCSYCENETIYTWEIWKVENVYDVITEEKEVPVYKTIKLYEEQEVPVYSFRMVDKEEKIEEPVYEKVDIPQYGEVTYYRYKTCTIEKGITDIKWSNTNLDSNLIGKGYKLTGNVKEA